MDEKGLIYYHLCDRMMNWYTVMLKWSDDRGDRGEDGKCKCGSADGVCQILPKWFVHLFLVSQLDAPLLLSPTLFSFLSLHCSLLRLGWNHQRLPRFYPNRPLWSGRISARKPYSHTGSDPLSDLGWKKRSTRKKWVLNKEEEYMLNFY